MANMLAKSADKSCCDHCCGRPVNKASRRANRTPEDRQWRAELVDEMDAENDGEREFAARLAAMGMTEQELECALDDNDGWTEYRG